MTTVQNSNGEKASYNPNTGNAAMAQKYSNGATTAQSRSGVEGGLQPHHRQRRRLAEERRRRRDHATSSGGEAKTKNGIGVAQGPNGETCAKGVNHAGCKKE